jgi:hypothetical protein
MCLNKNDADWMQDAGPNSRSKLCKQVDCFACMQGGKEEKRTGH